jgi:predicted dehydrogenase
MCLGIRAKGGRYADENLPHPSHALPAGVLHEFLTHMCYLVLCFVPRWDTVRAIWGNQGGGNLFKYDDLDALVLAHSARARIRFSCNQAPDCFTVVIRGSNGSLETDLFLPFVAANVPRRVGSQLSPLANQALRGGVLLRAGWTGFWNKVLQVTPYEGLQSFLAQTYAALANGDEPPVTREDSLAAARLVDALVAEAHTA